jgi:hypothetical protein
MNPFSTLLKLIALGALAIALVGCNSDAGATSDSNSAKPSGTEGATKNDAGAEAELKAMMDAQIDAMNKEDVSAYLATIDPSSPAYEPTKSSMEQLFKQYDLKATLHSCEMVSEKEGEAKIRTVISTEKVEGPDFQDNKITAVHTVLKKEGKWVLSTSEIENIEPIKK